MLYQIIALLLEVGAGLVGGTCLLRLYMQWLRIPLSARSGNPLAKFIFALTDWLVLPLRRVFPAVGALDTASLVGAFLLELAQFSILWALTGFAAPMASVVVLAALGLVRLVISGLTALIIAYAILSWIPSSGYSPFGDLVQRLTAPVLAPIRKVLPLVGGIDLSPLVLLLALQVLLIVLGSFQVGVLGWVSS